MMELGRMKRPHAEQYIHMLVDIESIRLLCEIVGANGLSGLSFQVILIFPKSKSA